MVSEAIDDVSGVVFVPDTRGDQSQGTVRRLVRASLFGVDGAGIFMASLARRLLS